MSEMHYSVAELSGVGRGPAVDHLLSCEACHYLLALVRRTNGEPSDEDAEVTVDALRSWASEPGLVGH